LTRFVIVSDEPSTKERDGFVHAYKEVFSEPPYFEHYTYDEVVEDVWDPHVRDGIIILAFEQEGDDERVVGFGTALPLIKASADTQKFMESLQDDEKPPIDYARTWYMSELGVLEPYRRRGLGYSLVKHRLLTIAEQGFEHYLFRTAIEGSKSLILYRKLGAVEVSKWQDISASGQVQVNGSQSTHRVYLYGDCGSALEKLASAA